VKGDDGGCFAAALASVRKWGGVLEHPADSSAWDTFGLQRPPRSGGWVLADSYGWTCCVFQGWYGHPAKKATWLYAVGCELPDLNWGPSPGGIKFEDSYHSAEECRRAVRTGILQRLSHRQRKLTPEPFRDLLLHMAATAKPPGRPMLPLQLSFDYL
jgi:hypothetical protein